MIHRPHTTRVTPVERLRLPAMAALVFIAITAEQVDQDARPDLWATHTQGWNAKLWSPDLKHRFDR